MKIDKNIPIPKMEENELHQALDNMKTGDSVLINDYEDRKAILEDVRKYCSTKSKNLSVKIIKEGEGFRMWLVSNAIKNPQKATKNEINRLEKALDNQSKEIERMKKEMEVWKQRVLSDSI